MNLTTSATIIADHISDGNRLTTFEVTFPRYVLAEFNTHRMLCLSGDTDLWFRQPNGITRKETIAEFYDKWHNGAKSRPSKKGKSWPTHRLELDQLYPMSEASQTLGMSSYSSLNRYCREGRIKARKTPASNEWYAVGQDIIDGLRSKPNRQPIKDRLKEVAIYQLDEQQYSLSTSTITDVIYSGQKTVYRVDVGGHSIKTSKDHLFHTPAGWQRLDDLEVGSLVSAVRYGKRPEDRTDPRRLKQIQGKWTSQWNRQIKSQLPDRCRCGRVAKHVHHVVPVHQRPDLAFDLDNVEHLCLDCHRQKHSTQGWQTGNPMLIDYLPIESITELGEESTYDLSIAGQYPNFIANGFVVHNSRNSASSRAIPIEKIIKRVEESPFIPRMGSLQGGMQAGPDLSGLSHEAAVARWLSARDAAVSNARQMLQLGVHKQVVNRLLEPFLYHTVIATATDWENFFYQRSENHGAMADPAISQVATMMEDLYRSSTPKSVSTEGVWHLPYFDELGGQADDWQAVDYNLEVAQKVSAARCARVSYLTHDGKRDIEKDLKLFDDTLAKHGHWSPMEHVAQSKSGRYGNFNGWQQLRQQLEAS